MVTFTHRGVTLSAHAFDNDRAIGVPVLTPGRGDFAEREGGRKRRKARRNRLASKRAWLES